jgi:predicted amidohydrolase
MKDIRIAAVIFNSPLNRIRHNLDRMTDWVHAAKNKGALLVCFPELNITGYSAEQDIKKSAEPVPGSISRNLAQMAREHQIVILAGLIENDETGRVFASHLVVSPNGSWGVYRKIHIAPPERNLFSPGAEVPLFDIQGIKFGIQLCYDAHFPELSTRMAIDGADVIFMPHASPRGTPSGKFNSWMRHLTARAFDNSLFIVACNQTGENQKGLDFPGIAVILGPDGQILAKDISGKEAIISADLKSDDLANVRSHPMRYFLPNRRPEIYHHEK